jgi:hypothetical protein
MNQLKTIFIHLLKIMNHGRTCFLYSIVISALLYITTGLWGVFWLSLTAMYLVSFLYANASLMANHLEISNEALKNMLKFHEEKLFFDDSVLRDMKKRLSLVDLDNLDTLEKFNLNDLETIANSTQMNLEVINTMLEANNKVINVIKSTMNEYGEL